jgi:outer membrane protein OmpA-like peptidoglycan-associated protein
MRCLPLLPLCLLAILLSPLWAQAQEKGFDVQAFRPYGGPLDLARVAQSRPVAHGSLVGGVFLNHMVDPLVLVRKGAQVKSVSLVGNRLQVDVLATGGLWDWGELALVVPVVAAQGGDNLEAIGAERYVRSGVLGDIRLQGKLAVPGLRRPPGESGLGVALLLGVGLPTGSVDDFAGEGVLTSQAGLAVDWRFDSGALLSLNTGVWLKPSRYFLNARLGSLGTLGLAGEVPIVPNRRVSFLGMFTAGTPLEELSLKELPRRWPMEAMVGLRWYGPQSLTYTVGGGLGCSCALTVPPFRVFASVAWVLPDMAEREALEQTLAGKPQGPLTPQPEVPLYAQPVDADNDYVVAPWDACPQEPGPAENKGCPDKDRDGDGLVDREDKCPSHAQGPRGSGGCPLARLEGGRLVLTERVKFHSSQAILQTSAEPVLADVARVLIENPEVRRVDVEVWAPVADEEEVTLARKRAEVVRRYIVLSGVSMERVCTAVQVDPEHQVVPGGRLELVVPAQPQPCPEDVASRERGTQPERPEGAWELVRKLEHNAAWLALGVKGKGTRREMLWYRAQEGGGSKVGRGEEEQFQRVLEQALARHVPRRGTGVVVLAYGGGRWFAVEEASGEDLLGELADTHYELWVRQKMKQLTEEGRESRAQGWREALRWLKEQPTWYRYSAAPAPWDLKEEYEKATAREHARKAAEEEKLDEYIQWSQRFHAQQILPPFRLAPGYLVSESPLRKHAVEALIAAVLEWGSTHMRAQDPLYLELSPQEVAEYLLASRSYLAEVVKAGERAPVEVEYNPALDPTVYTPEELALEVLAGLPPYVGEATDLWTAAQGKTLTGKPMDEGERLVQGLAALLPFVGGTVVRKGPEAVEQAVLLGGRSAKEMQVLARVASQLAPEEVKDIQRALERLEQGGKLAKEELEALERIAQRLQGPIADAARALQQGQKVALLGVRTLPDGSRMLVGSPVHQAQCWVEYQLRHVERFKGFRFEVDPEWKRMYESILANKPAGTDFELKVLKFGRYEKNSALMMPPPGSGRKGFIPDAVKGNPPELVWGRPYDFVEVKAWKDLSLTGNLEAMLQYVRQYGGHVELWIRSKKHPSGATKLTKPLEDLLIELIEDGKATIREYP